MLKPKIIVIGVLAVLALGGALLPFVGDWARQASERFEENRIYAHCQWGDPPNMSTEGWTDHYAQYDFLAFSPGAWDYPNNQQAKTELRIKNIDIHLGTYYNVHTAPIWMQKDYERGLTNYGALYWNAVAPFLARTTEGDTASIFANTYVWDVNNKEARTRAIEVLNDYVRRNGLSWVMLDFFTTPLPDFKPFFDPIFEEMEEGDLDFDQNGIAHWVDAEEILTLTKSWKLYIKEIREALPRDVLLIPNGRLALRDDSFACLADGAYIEGFPMWFFGTFDANLYNALSPDYEHSLWELTSDRWYRNPGFVMLENRTSPNYLEKICLFFTGSVALYRPLTGDAPMLPISNFEIDFGAYIDDSYVMINDGNVLLISREFETNLYSLRLENNVLELRDEEFNQY